MQVTIFGGHPSGNESSSYQFLKASIPNAVNFFQIPQTLTADIKKIHQQQILSAERILLQFPLFWYQAPGLVADWLTAVFDEQFLSASNLANKNIEFGIILTVGVPLKEYQAGGRENVTISELLRPYQTFAHALKFNYLPPFILAQYGYQSPEQQKMRLVEFQQYLTLPANPNFQQRSQWLIDELIRMQAALTDNVQKQQIQIIITEWAERLDDLGLLEAQLPKTTWR